MQGPVLFLQAKFFEYCARGTMFTVSGMFVRRARILECSSEVSSP